MAKAKTNISEKIYALSGELSYLIYQIGLNGWANEMTLKNDKTGEEVEVRIKVDIKRLNNPK